MEDVDNVNDDESRNRNLDILKAYIQRQRTLLEHIKLDINRLQELKQPAQEDPNATLNGILDGDNCDNDGDVDMWDSCVGQRVRVQRLVELVKEVHGGREGTIVDSIQFDEAFSGHDPSPLRELAMVSRSLHRSEMFPPDSFTSSPTTGAGCPTLHPKLAESALRVRIREARLKLVEPALAQNAEFLASLPPDLDEECAKGKGKASARTKARRQNGKHFGNAHGTQRRKKHDNSAKTVVRPRGPGGVFVKRSAASNAEGHAQQSPMDASPDLHDFSAPPRQRRMSSVSSIAGENEEGRPKRVRRSSTRRLANSPEPPATHANGRGRGKGKARADRQSTSSISASASVSPVPTSEPPRVRLTIRIPARAATLTWSGHSHANGRGGASGVPSASPSVSFATSPSIPTRCSTTMGERVSFSPSVTRSVSPARLVKEEDEDAGVVVSKDRLIRGFQSGEKLGDHRAVESRAHCFAEGSNDSLLGDFPHIDEREQRPKAEDSGVVFSSDEDESDDEFLDGPVRTGGTAVAISAKGIPLQLDSSTGRGKRKSKSTTFKQSWSVAEQHLLDQLLEQFPDGTKLRWAKISKAMDGRRTPRQVASRVQKYFAKMKKFGLDVNSK